VPPCQGRRKYRDVRGEWSVGGWVAGSCGATQVVAAATGRKWRQSSYRAHSATCRVPLRPGRGDATGFRRGATTSQTVSQHRPRLRYPGEKPALLSSQQHEAYIGFGETASVIDAITRQADPWASLPVLILKLPNNPILHPCALSDYNCGATLIRARMCVHVFFHRIRDLAGPMETPLCKISF
jgi:hypothetical protein